MRRCDQYSYLNNPEERQRVKELMEKQWQRKGVAKATRKCEWPMPAYTQAKLLKEGI